MFLILKNEVCKKCHKHPTEVIYAPGYGQIDLKDVRQMFRCAICAYMEQIAYYKSIQGEADNALPDLRLGLQEAERLREKNKSIPCSHFLGGGDFCLTCEKHSNEHKENT